MTKNKCIPVTTRFKYSMIAAVVLAAAIFPVGCAGQKEVAGRWRGHDVAVDGRDNEWQASPQYYDKDKHITVRIVNDAEALFLAVSTSDRSVARQLQMAGLTIWFDPEGGAEKVLGLHLPSMNRRPEGPPGGGARVEDGFGQRNASRSPEKDETRSSGPTPAPEPIQEMEITYSDTTGPLRMKMDEIRRTGIDICTGSTGKGRMVYELMVKFKAAPCLEQLKPGMILGIGILSASSGQPGGPQGDMGMGGPPRAQAGPSQSMGGMGGPGGGMGGRPGGGGRNQGLEIWLKVRLADPAGG